MKLKNDKLYKQARDVILNMIETDFEPMQQFYSENKLSKMLGVSRNTIREALRSLEQDGIIYSKQGVGTFVIGINNNVKTNITSLESSTKIIQDNGYKPGTIKYKSNRVKASESIAKKLNLTDDKEIFYIERVRTADKKPVVYVEDYLPILPGMEGSGGEFGESLFDYFSQIGLKIGFSNARIKSVISSKKMMNKLNLEEVKALLLLEQIHFSDKGEAVLYSDSYFLSDKFEFNVIRKK